MSRLLSSIAFRATVGNGFANSAVGIVLVLLALGGRPAVATGQAHQSDVSAVAFSLDGTRLASASYDKTVKVWDARTGRLALTINGDTGKVFAVAFSPDGTRLASASDDQTVKIWGARLGQQVLSLKGHTWAVVAVSFSPDGILLASGSSDQTVKVWDARTGHEALTLKGHTSVVNAVSFRRDGTRLASASSDKTVKVWDARTGQEILTLNGHTDLVRSVVFSPDGTRLASASHDRTVKVWDAQTGKETFTFKGHTGEVTAVAFSPDGTRIATGGYQTVKVWDAGTGRESMAGIGHTGWVYGASFSPDGTRLATGSGDSTVRLWNSTTGDELASLPAVTFSPMAPSLDTDSLCVLICVSIGLILVALMRRHMLRNPCSASRLILIYKMWHFPTFLVLNGFTPRFWVLFFAMSFALGAIAGCTVGGYVLGGLLGAAWNWIGAGIGLFASILICEGIVMCMMDQEYLDNLSHDMLSGAADLVTVENKYLFPLFCAAQTIALLGVLGSLLGTFIEERVLSPVPLAIVSAFIGFFLAQVLAFAKKESKAAFRLGLSVLQVVVVGLLLLPAKQLLAEQNFAKATLDALAQVLGGDLGLDAVFGGAVGLLTSLLTSAIARPNA